MRLEFKLAEFASYWADNLNNSITICSDFWDHKYTFTVSECEQFIDAQGKGPTKDVQLKKVYNKLFWFSIFPS